MKTRKLFDGHTAISCYMAKKIIGKKPKPGYQYKRNIGGKDFWIIPTTDHGKPCYYLMEI